MLPPSTFESHAMRPSQIIKATRQYIQKQLQLLKKPTTQQLIRDKSQIYWQLMRADRPIGTYLLLAPTLWAVWIAANGKPPFITLLAFTMGVFLMRSAGCVANDWADREIDDKVERTKMRPVAQGLVSKREVVRLTLGLSFLALFCLIPFSWKTWVMAVPAVCLALIIYPLAKRWFPIPQLILGISFSFGIPMAFMAVQNDIPPLAWWLFSANVCWTLAYDTIYAISDKPDDLKLNIKTSAITFGKYDAEGAMLAYALFNILMMQVGLLLNAVWCYWVVLMITIYWQWQYYLKIQKRHREVCFEVFLDNNKIGIAWFIGIVMHYSYM